MSAGIIISLLAKNILRPLTYVSLPTINATNHPGIFPVVNNAIKVEFISILSDI
jgi:hypothetical protein